MSSSTLGERVLSLLLLGLTVLAIGTVAGLQRQSETMRRTLRDAQHLVTVQALQIAELEGRPPEQIEVVREVPIIQRVPVRIGCLPAFERASRVYGGQP